MSLLKNKNILSKWVVTIVIVACIVASSVKLNDDICYYVCREKTIKYVKKRYSKGIILKNSIVGRSAYPADRIPHQFFFYDKNNDIYFRIVYGKNGIDDHYIESYNGQFLEDEISTYINTELQLQSLIRCFVPEPGNYESAMAQIVIFTDEFALDKEQMCSLINCIKSIYKEITITLSIADISNETAYKKMFSYEKISSLIELPHDKYYIISTKNLNLLDVEELDKFIVE